MLSRKDYRAIAEIIKKEYGRCLSAETQFTLDDIVNNLADYFAVDNPRFNNNKFMVACGLD